MRPKILSLGIEVRYLFLCLQRHHLFSSSVILNLFDFKAPHCPERYVKALQLFVDLHKVKVIIKKKIKNSN